jgi:hypothetical protein
MEIRPVYLHGVSGLEILLNGDHLDSNSPSHFTWFARLDAISAQRCPVKITIKGTLAWIPTEADVSNKILSKVIILGHPAWEEVSQLQNL